MSFIRIKNRIVHYQWMPNESKVTYAFINSLGSDFRIWNDVVNHLNANASILLFDKAGHGLSDDPTESWLMRSYADDLILLMDRFRIDKIHLVGLSIGGMIAMEFAIHYPDRLSRLILCDTGPKIGSTDLWEQRIRTIEKYNIEYLSDSIMANWFSPAFKEDHSHIVDGHKIMLEKTSKSGYLTACRCIRDTDLRQDLDRILSRTLCICGTEDIGTTPESMKHLSNSLANGQYTEIKGAAHLPCIEFPVQVAQLIKEFT